MSSGDSLAERDFWDELQAPNLGGLEVKENGISVIKFRVDNEEIMDAVLKSSTGRMLWRSRMCMTQMRKRLEM